jgi:Pyruvate/2-oxoacid:ferredoxin oxidoreductase gamma subunit
VIAETFPGKVGELNVEATRKAYEMGWGWVIW